VTKYLENLPNDSNLPISTLAKKFAMLLALSGSKRQSDLRALDTRFKKHIPEGETFQLATLPKNRSSKSSMEVFFPSFTHNKKLYPIACLDSYVKGSKAWRGVGSKPQPLFLSFQAPHKPVSSETIGRWLKDIIKELRLVLKLTHLKLIPLVGRQVQLQGTEGSLSKKSYKQVTGPGKRHSTVFTIALSILTHSAKPSSMVSACFKQTN